MIEGRAPLSIFTDLCVAAGTGRVRLLVTGASPISEEVFDFLRVCFGADVIEVQPQQTAQPQQTPPLPSPAPLFQNTAGQLPCPFLSLKTGLSGWYCSASTAACAAASWLTAVAMSNTDLPAATDGGRVT